MMRFASGQHTCSSAAQEEKLPSQARFLARTLHHPKEEPVIPAPRGSSYSVHAIGIISTGRATPQAQLKLVARPGAAQRPSQPAC